MKSILPSHVSTLIEPLEPRIAPAVVAAIDLSTLDGQTGFKVSGLADDDFFAVSVRGAGDVNGDGFADVIVAAPFTPGGGTLRGESYVVFGKAGGFGPSVDLAALDGTDGFKLSGLADSDFAGFSVSAAGDVNGDGFGDLVVSAPRAAEGGTHRGATYVVFGKADFSATAGSFDLSGLDGTNGFKMIGGVDHYLTGTATSGAGDVNRDGFADLIVTAGGLGAIYVVFGKPNFTASFDLSTLDGSNGFSMTDPNLGTSQGNAVSAAGDINGDGFGDIILGTSIAEGSSYVIFGKAGGFGAMLDLTMLDGTNGFVLNGLVAGDKLGTSVKGAGDVNGDGFADFIVGAFEASEGGTERGACYLIFGRADFSATAGNFDLAALDGTNGFKLSGLADGDRTSEVSAAGDVNGDGLGDVIVGSTLAAEGGTARGASYVVFGKTDFSFTAGSFDLATLDGTNGFKLSGIADNDAAGAVSAAGDVNGDGFDDLIIGATGAAEGGTKRGAAYVVFGFGTGEVTLAKNGKSATFTDWDGDRVTIKSTKGPLDVSQFKLSSLNPLTGGAHLIYADFSDPIFNKANLTFTATRSGFGGDGLVNIGTINAGTVLLGRVSVDGDLQQIDAAGVAGLTVYSLGQFAPDDLYGGPLTSKIEGKLGALTIKTDATRVTIAAETIGAIRAVNLDAVQIFAEGVANPARAASAVAIKSLTVTGSVTYSRILAGYDATGRATNADVQIGAVTVKGNWVASDLAAGVTSGTGGIFADGDVAEAVIAGGNAITSRIAAITIGGAAFGTANNARDGFGFAAEEIGSLKIGKARIPLQKRAGNDLIPFLLSLTNDIRVREVA